MYKRQGGVQFGTSCIGVEQITAAVRKHCTKPLMVKLSPNVTDIGDIAASAEAGGADAISMINTLTGKMCIRDRLTDIWVLTVFCHYWIFAINKIKAFLY